MAVLCNTLTGIDRTCDSNQGAVSAIYLADFGAITATTISAGTITAINMMGGESFVEIKFNKNMANFTEDFAVDDATGGQGWAQAINVTIPRREVAKRNSIALMAEGNRDLALITKDGNGLYNFWGYTSGVNLKTVNSASGENKKVGTSYKLTFLGDEIDQAPFVSPSIIAGLL